MKKLAVLVLAFVGLGVFVYFYEIQGQEKREKAKEAEESLFRMKRDEVTRLEVNRAGQGSVVLKNEGDDWVMTHPAETAADETTVDSVLRNVETARRERTFPEGGSQAADYGLQEPRLTLKVEAAGQVRTLLMGKDDYTGTQIYVRFQGDQDVHLTSDSILTTSDKGVFDWRSKTVLPLERDKIRAIEVDRPQGGIALRRQDEEWMLVAPFQEPADSSAVNGLLSSLEFAQAQKFVVEKVEDLKRYGLDKPSVRIRIQEQGQEAWKSLELGKKDAADYLARDPDRSPVFTVKEELRNKLMQKVWEFRDKDVVDVAQDEVAQLAIHSEGQEILLKQQDGKWVVEKPEGQKGKEALTYKFWYPIDDIKFESIEERAAHASAVRFPEPDVQIVLTLKDHSTRSYDFVKKGDRYLALSRDTGRQGTISKDAFEKLQFKVEEIV